MLRTLNCSSARHRLDRRIVWRDHALEILLTQWDRRRHPQESEASTDVAVMEFMFAGACRKTADGKTDVGDCNSAMMFRAGEQFVVDHPAGAANAGLSIRLRNGLSAPMMREMEHGNSAVVSAEAFGKAVRLAHALDRATLDAAQVESCVHGLIGCVLERNGVKAISRSAERARVGEAQAYLSSVTDRPVTLIEVADAAAWSPWHLVRAFRRQTGVSPYRYHVRLRLRAALGQAMRGRDGLTAIALNAGFSSHSHFTQAFRREFGDPPSAMMRSLRMDG